MARMYPTPIDPGTESRAERMLYEVFRDNLDHEYSVFHSVSWQSVDKNRRPRDGEADFVVTHPRYGVLVIEVKGGAIRFDPQTGIWTSTSANGITHTIKDPIKQVRTARYTLRDVLAEMLKRYPDDIRIGHAVAFPDVPISGSLGLDMPRQILLDQNDVLHIAQWVQHTLDYWRGQAPHQDNLLGKAVLDTLVRVLGKVRELHPALWGTFAYEQQQLLTLTEEQYTILDILNFQRRAAISGCAGSGKTMLALEKATRLAQQGLHVLLTCFNERLSYDLNQRVSALPTLHIVHFHKLCFDMAQRAGIPLPRHTTDDFFTQDMPNALLQALDHIPDRYDAIIVDEGQDFYDNWWIPLQMLQSDRTDGVFYIFYDDNQRLYVQSSEFPIKDPLFPLTINCRTTQHIHQHVVRFYQGAVLPKARGPQGREVQIERYEDAGMVRLKLLSVLRRLTVQEKIPSDQLLVLTPFSHDKSNLWARTPARGVDITDVYPPPANSIYCTSIHAFKGLERAVVVLAEVERWPHQYDLERLLYVACSRACNHLIVLLPDDVPANISDYFLSEPTK